MNPNQTKYKEVAMRRHSIYVVLLALLGIWAFAQKVDIATEKEAIKVAIQDEKDAFRTLDYEGYAASWVQAPYTLHPGFGQSQITFECAGRILMVLDLDEHVVGWDSISVVAKNVIETMKKEPDKNRIDELTASNFDIHLNGNIAFVIYDENSKGIFGGEPFSTESNRQVIYLVKKDEEWKLVAIFNL